MHINCLFFDDFETLDIFGPIQVFGRMNECYIKYISMAGGIIISNQNTQIITEDINKIENYDVLVIPGGKGTRELVKNDDFIAKLRTVVQKTSWCLTVCTGSALLAKTGLLDNFEATSNKMSFEWVKTNSEFVKWKYKARWVVDNKYYTSSGISAGIDMSLGFIYDHFGEEKAKKISKIMEYEWNNNRENDVFAI